MNILRERERMSDPLVEAIPPSRTWSWSHRALLPSHLTSQDSCKVLLSFKEGKQIPFLDESGKAVKSMWDWKYYGGHLGTIQSAILCKYTETTHNLSWEVGLRERHTV